MHWRVSEHLRNGSPHRADPLGGAARRPVIDARMQRRLRDRMRVLAYCLAALVLGFLVVWVVERTVWPHLGAMPFSVVEGVALLCGAALLELVRRDA